MIDNPDQRFAAFLSPLTLGRVNIAVNSVYISKVSLAIAVRYSLSRRAFSIAPDAPESRSPRHPPPLAASLHCCSPSIDGASLLRRPRPTYDY
ncbi:hypothetical protein ZEAMMB73_Zm00001d012317 [Zea mays]|uniref:Uncharacterized protein n=1 Tax=Zea mays TaxID=4577 RepID=A0A1D6G854_MAIZE|nr:hypothetical protein ZEAMMB73_Zm00001d012317 [Zea mays]